LALCPGSCSPISPMRRSKLGALELAAMSLKATGTCERRGHQARPPAAQASPAPRWIAERAAAPCPADLSRTLSYAGAEFALGHVDVDEVFKVRSRAC
jgi:hypothetical protein